MRIAEFGGLVALGSVALALVSCGSGSAAIGSSGGGGSGGTVNAGTVGTAPRVTAANDDNQRALVSPATIRFELTDEEGDPAEVVISFARTDDQGNPVGSFTPITQAPLSIPAGAPQLDLNALPTGTGELKVGWDFESDFGGAGFEDNIALQLEVVGGTSPAIVSGIAVGNDTPILSTNFAPPAGIGAEDPFGNIDVRFGLSDSGGDRVDVMVEFDVLDDSPDAGFRLARSTSTDSADPTPQFAFSNLQTTADGNVVTFRWDSAFASGSSTMQADTQLAGREERVKFRITVRERVAGDNQPNLEVAMETPEFRVDNNAPPLATLLEGSFLVGIKDRGNIPIEFQILDAESDPVRAILQWRTDGQLFANQSDPLSPLLFPALPTDEADLIDLLENPGRAGERRLLQIAQEESFDFRGKLASFDGLAADQARLPELAGSAAGLLAFGLAGRTLEIMRPALVLESPDWPTAVLDLPVGIQLQPNGTSAWILDRGAGGWRVRLIHLETGDIELDLANGPGEPAALAISPTRERLFVASSSSLFSIDLSSGNTITSLPHDFGSSPRGLAAIGSNQVAVSGDNRVVRADFLKQSLTDLRIGLQQPFGLAIDPRDQRRLLIAEFDASRILELNLDTQLLRRLPALVAPDDQPLLGQEPFPKPSTIAFDNEGGELLAICDTGSKLALRRLDLGISVNFDQSGPEADPFVSEINATGLESGGGLASGAGAVRVATVPGSNNLIIGGGVRQSRQIIDQADDTRFPPTEPYDPSTQVVQLRSAFNPQPPAGSPWRIRTRVTAAGSPNGRSFTFLWNSTDVPDANLVQIQVTPRDTDVGIVSTASSFRSYRASFPQIAGSLGFGSNSPAFDLQSKDIDGDGDQDTLLAYPGQRRLVLFKRNAANSTSLPISFPLNQQGVTNPSPVSIAIEDFSLDGKMDVVSANNADSSLTVYYQNSDGTFGEGDFKTPSLVFPFAGAKSVVALDLKTDGNADFAATGDAGLQFFTRSPFLTFSQQNIAGAAPGESLHAADMDNDGDSDLVQVIKQDSQLALYLQDESGEFPLAPTLLNTGPAPVEASAADLNNDGYLDLVSANSGGNDLSIFFQAENGTFAQTPISIGLDGPTSVETADLDGDGDMDIAASGAADELVLFYQVQAGVFARGTSTLATASGPAAISAFDGDGDGRTDLACVNRNDNILKQVSIFPQEAAGQLTLGSTTIDTLDGSRTLGAADLDSDGDKDLFAARPFQEDLAIAIQTAPGVFSALNRAFPAPGAFMQAATDLDGDGAVDLIGCSGSTIYLGYQNGPGSFMVAQTLPANDIFGEMEAADLNGDGRMDLIGTQAFQQALVLFEQSPTAGFPKSAELIPSGIGPRSLEVVDIDLDGDLDLITANFGDFSNPNKGLGILLRSSSGTYQEFDIDLPSGGLTLDSGDFDADGDIDLVTVNADESALLAFFQTSPLAFSPGTPLALSTVQPFPDFVPSGSYTPFVAAEDLDGDGDMEFISRSRTNQNPELYVQLSPGRYTTPPLMNSPVSGTPNFMLPVDIDCDGDLDVVSINPDTPVFTSIFTFHLNGD